MALFNYELARRQDGKVELRPEPLRVRWNFIDLTTADGHRLHCAFNASARAIDDPTERQMVQETFLNRKPTLTVDDVTAHFASALHAAATAAAMKHPVDDWLGGNAKEDMIATMQKEANRVAFACGLEILPPFGVEFESPSFQQQKIEALERTLTEKRVAGQVEHFERAAALLKQFESIRQSAPQLSPGAVLEQISPADRGAMLQTLLMAAAKSAGEQSLWAVAGPYLIRIDARVSPPQTDLLPLPPTLGPLRSVQSATLEGQRVLLVGARSGVMVVHPEQTHGAVEPRFYSDPEIVSQLGFSKALIWNDQLWACHGDGGVVCWDIEQGGHPSTALRPVHLAAVPAGAAPLPLPPPMPVTPPPLPDSMNSMTTMTQSMLRAEVTHSYGARHLSVLDDGRLVCNFGRELLIIDRAAHVTHVPLDSMAEVVALVCDSRQLVVVHDDGTIVMREASTLATTGEEHRNTRLLAAATLPWLGVQRLLLTSEDGPVQCLGLDDGLVSEYQSPHRGPRLVAGAADLVAAVSSDRQRLVVWNSWDGRRPTADLSLAALAKHRVADIEFG